MKRLSMVAEEITEALDRPLNRMRGGDGSRLWNEGKRLESKLPQGYVVEYHCGMPQNDEELTVSVMNSQAIELLFKEHAANLQDAERMVMEAVAQDQKNTGTVGADEKPPQIDDWDLKEAGDSFAYTRTLEDGQKVEVAFNGSEASFKSGEKSETVDWDGSMETVQERLNDSMSWAKTGDADASVKAGGTVSKSKVDVNDPSFDSDWKMYLKALQDGGFKLISLDDDSGKLSATFQGIPVRFVLGGENLYMNFNELYIKGGAEEGTSALADFLKVIQNFGGSK